MECHRKPAQAIDHALSVLPAYQQVMKALGTSVDLVHGHEGERLQIIVRHAHSTERRSVDRLTRVAERAAGKEGWDAWVVAVALAVAGKMRGLAARLATLAIEAAVLATVSQAPRVATRGSFRAPPHCGGSG